MSTPAKPMPEELSARSEHRLFAFVMNIRKLVGSDQFELAPDRFLRKANDEEIDDLRTWLPSVLPYTARISGIPWQLRRISGDEQPFGLTTVLLREEWRYYGFECDPQDPTLSLLEASMALAHVPLRLAGMFSKGHIDFDSAKFARHFSTGTPPESFYVDVTQDHAESIGKIYRALVNAPDEWKDLARNFTKMDTVPDTAGLRFLGYFALLESALTHKPDPKDPYDSITRQVTAKLALLNHQWSPQLDYNGFGTVHDTLWKKMYSYRSQIAHGGKTVIPNDLNVLRSYDQAITLLISAVSAIIRYALQQRVLVEDLRNC